MPILTLCPNCQRNARIAKDAVGKTVRFSGCEQSFAVPAGSGDVLVEWGPIGSGRRAPLNPGRTLTIGLSKENALNLLGPLVSRRHAALDWVESEWRLRDRESGNGAFVNGEWVREIGRTDGCRIVIGDFALRVALASTGPGEGDLALDAMALDESGAGSMAIVESSAVELDIDPHAETAEGVSALLPPAEDEPQPPPGRQPLWNRWPVLAGLLIAIVAIVALLVRLTS